MEVEDLFPDARGGGTAFGREGSDGSKGSQGSKGKVGGSAASINKTFTTGLCLWEKRKTVQPPCGRGKTSQLPCRRKKMRLIIVVGILLMNSKSLSRIQLASNGQLLFCVQRLLPACRYLMPFVSYAAAYRDPSPTAQDDGMTAGRKARNADYKIHRCEAAIPHPLNPLNPAPQSGAPRRSL